MRANIYINKQSARLRDINELFMDTGLGREGYSNIGQGRIDEILSLKSADRREIFRRSRRYLQIPPPQGGDGAPPGQDG